MSGSHILGRLQPAGQGSPPEGHQQVGNNTPHILLLGVFVYFMYILPSHKHPGVIYPTISWLLYNLLWLKLS